jgi:hydrogenase maturation protein HypF
LNLVQDKSRLDLFDKIIDSRINSPLSSGLGRLFDGVAALIGSRKQVSFEGQAAMELEMLATGSSGKPYPFDILRDKGEPHILEISAIIKAIVSDMETGQSNAKIAASFHQTIIDAFVIMAGEMRNSTGLTRVALSGGCFQNKILLEGAIDKLRNSGFDVFCHSQVPANDGGISLGQAVVSASMIKKGMV